MKTVLSKNKLSSVKTDLIVIPVAEGAEQGGVVRELSSAQRKAIARRIEIVRFKGKAGKTVTVQGADSDIVLVGLGDDKAPETYRRAGAKARAAAGSIRAGHVVIAAGSSAKKYADALLEGFLLGSYKWDKYKSGGDKNAYKGPKTLQINGTVPSGAAGKALIERTVAIAESVCLARDLVNEISKVKTPTFLGQTAKKIAKAGGLKCEVWQGARLTKEKMHGILAVSAGSEEPGALIHLHYKPKKKARGKVVLVGKGITFDSGGLSLKPAKSMEWMKQDMGGAAAVLGAMKAIAAVGPEVEVHGFVAAAENMPGKRAQKPGDVITYRNGKTAEVLNTDAEGRLVLADALCLATELEPDCIIDLATLTGACMVALGTKIAGVMGNDQALINALIKEGEVAGEGLWQLPLPDEYNDDIRAMTADIKNIGGGYGGTITAALFLQNFVGDTNWAHLDIAGPGFAEKPFPYCPRGGTGFGVRTLLNYVESL